MALRDETDSCGKTPAGGSSAFAGLPSYWDVEEFHQHIIPIIEVSRKEEAQGETSLTGSRDSRWQQPLSDKWKKIAIKRS